MSGLTYAQYGFILDPDNTTRNNLIIVPGNAYSIFKDGSVAIFSTRGHTPGHRSVLKSLADRGVVMLSGDMAHSFLGQILLSTRSACQCE